MNLGYFTEDAYDRLLNDVEINRDKYVGDEDWLDSYFGRGIDYSRISSVEVNKFKPTCSGSKNDEDKNNEDLTNAIAIHEAFKLTPLQATNKYMWSYLCHADKDCREYIKKRWEGSNIKQRYFVSNDGDGLYYFNALSRLWWGAHITYDANNKANPYALTKILFFNQMVCKDFLGTLNKANYSRMKGVLLALRDFIDKLGPREGVNKYFRDCNKILNHQAAVTVFDFLDSDEIYQLTLDTLNKVREQNKKG